MGKKTTQIRITKINLKTLKSALAINWMNGDNQYHPHSGRRARRWFDSSYQRQPIFMQTFATLQGSGVEVPERPQKLTLD